MRIVDQLVGPGDAVVDIGANWGLYTARLAQLVGRGGQVDAFEPHPDHAGTLSALGRQPQVAVHLVALSDADATAQLHVPVVGGRRVTALSRVGAGEAPAGHETVEVPVRRLDDELRGRRPPSFVKCDVEGLEGRVLRGGRETLAASLPTLLIEIEQRHQDGPIADTFAFLEGLGYEGHFISGGGLRPLAEFDVERDQLAHVSPGIVQYEMPAGYVADFVFAAPASDVAARVGSP
jgi:FkbM family methyltransferase